MGKSILLGILFLVFAATSSFASTVMPKCPGTLRGLVGSPESSKNNTGRVPSLSDTEPVTEDPFSGGRRTKPDPRHTTTKPDPKAMSIEEVWALYIKNKDTDQSSEYINELILRYTEWVIKTAEHLARKAGIRPDEIEDLVQVGLMALSQKIEEYIPERDVKFKSFAIQRVLGAMIDYLRRQSTHTRTVHTHRNLVLEIIESFKISTGRRPSEEELLRMLEETYGPKKAETLFENFESTIRGTLSLYTPVGEKKSLLDTVKNASEGGGQVAEKDFIKELLRGLSREEQLIIILYYSEGLTMKEIGKVLDVSESRVSQWHGSAIKKLQANKEWIKRQLFPE